MSHSLTLPALVWLVGFSSPLLLLGASNFRLESGSWLRGLALTTSFVHISAWFCSFFSTKSSVPFPLVADFIPVLALALGFSFGECLLSPLRLLKHELPLPCALGFLTITPSPIGGIPSPGHTREGLCSPYN